MTKEQQGDMGSASQGSDAPVASDGNAAARSELSPVAWLHDSHSSAYVITDRVKRIWLDVDAKHVEHYTIALYRGGDES